MPKKVAFGALAAALASALLLWMIASGWLPGRLRGQQQRADKTHSTGTQVLPVPDPPFRAFFMSFAASNGHAPHHTTKNWIAKFKGRFDEGWDRQREITLANQRKMGIVPADSVGMAISTVRAAQQEAVWVQTIRREGGSSPRSTVAPAVPRQDVEGRPHRKRK